MKFLCLIFILLLVGCYSGRHGVKLSKYSYNDKFHNSLIVNRVPDYGDGHRDGCIIHNEFLLSLKSSVNSEVIGYVKDVETLESMSGANISIWFQGEASPANVVADSNGQFKFVRVTDVVKIEVNFIGWRTMVVGNGRSRVL